jgi:hypothetical protein
MGSVRISLTVGRFGAGPGAVCAAAFQAVSSIPVAARSERFTMDAVRCRGVVELAKNQFLIE